MRFPRSESDFVSVLFRILSDPENNGAADNEFEKLRVSRHSRVSRTDRGIDKPEHDRD